MTDDPALSRALQLHRGGNLSAARSAYEQLLARDPDNTDAHHLLGLVLFQQGNVDAAGRHLERSLEDRPGDAVMHNNYGEILRAQGRASDALEHYRRAISIKPDYAEPHNNLAAVMIDLGRLRDAREHAQHALAIQPDHADAWFNLGLARQMEGDWAQAEENYIHALELAGPGADVLNNLALCHQQQGRWTAARERYRQALEVRESLQALNNLAELCERTGCIDQARELNARALELDADDPHALLVAARIALRSDQTADAIDLLRRAAAVDAPDNVIQAVQFELGQALDRSGDYRGAWDALVLANELQRRDNRYAEVRAERFLERVHRSRDALSRLRLPAAAAADADAPVFMLGFPRSGTTLLDQILDAHPGLVVMEERPCLEAVEMETQDFPAGLSGADPDQQTRCRARYVACASGFVTLPVGARLVDKYPLNIIRAPLIQWLFPGAPVLLSLRHPCDVVLSCFMQQFIPNDAMANFSSIQAAARAYAEIMSLWELAREKLALNVHVVRYEELVDDFEHTVSACLDFLQLPWTDSVRDFAGHARTRERIATPSYRQVTKPLYGGSRGRWRRYREHLEAVLPVLAPWVERYGYSLD